MEAWHRGELLALDFETTGVDRREDVPVAFALVSAAKGRVVDLDAGLVDPGRTIPREAVAVHGITTERARSEGRPLPEALDQVAARLLDASRRGVPLVGMNLAFDLSILDHQLERHLGRGLEGHGWRGPVLDVLVLDRQLDRYRPGRRCLSHLCAHYAVANGASHDAGADATAAIGVLLALCRRYPVLPGTGLGRLTYWQAVWHRRWAASYDRWRASEGLAPLAPVDYDWPIARPEAGHAAGGKGR